LPTNGHHSDEAAKEFASEHDALRHIESRLSEAVEAAASMRAAAEAELRAAGVTVAAS
jgi:hypothetical protein